MSASQECFVVEAKAPQTHTIILLHGRGSTGEEFADDLFECEITNPEDPKSSMTLQDKFPSCRWIFPNARPRYSTVFQEEMTEWFDIYSLTDPEQQGDLQLSGLVESLQLITRVIQEEAEKTKLDRIIIGGISQGFATAATFLMALDFKCAGFIGLSGWIPFASQIQEAVVDEADQSGSGKAAQHATAAIRQILHQHKDYKPSPISPGNWHHNPMFIGHEQHDTVVAVELGEAACKVFQACGVKPAWHTYDSGDHWIQEPDEIGDLAQFIEECIKNSQNQT